MLLPFRLGRVRDSIRKRLHQRREIVINERREICVAIGGQTGGESRRMPQRHTRIVIFQGLLDQRASRSGDQIPIGEGVVDFHSKILRLESMESEAAGIFSVQRQTLLPFLCSLLIDFLDHTFDRLLQMHRVVDLENQFPRRYRQHGTVNRERVLAPERRREILTQVEAVIVLQLRQVLIEIRTHGTQRSQHIVNQRRGVFDHKAAYQIGIGRDVFQRAHRRRRG